MCIVQIVSTPNYRVTIENSKRVTKNLILKVNRKYSNKIVKKIESEKIATCSKLISLITHLLVDTKFAEPTSRQYFSDGFLVSRWVALLFEITMCFVNHGFFRVRTSINRFYSYFFLV